MSSRPPASTNWIARVISRVLASPRRSWFALGIVAIVAALGASMMRIEFSSRAFYAANPSAQATFARFQKHFGPDDGQLTVVVERADGDLLVRGSLELVDYVAQHLAVLPGVTAVLSPTDFPVDVDDEGSPRPLLAARIEAQTHGAAAVERWRTHALADTRLVPGLLSADARAAALIVELEHSSDRADEIRHTVRSIETFLTENSRPDGLTFTMAGIPAVRVAFTDLVVHDQVLLGPITLLIVALGLVHRFRRAHAMYIPLLAAGYPLLLLAAIMGVTDTPIGLLSQSLFTLIPVLAVADTVHWIVRFYEEAQARQQEPWTPSLRRDVIVAAGTHIGYSCLLTTVTTALGFASLLATDIGLLRELGLLAAAGIGLAYATSLVLVPLLLDTIDQPPHRRRPLHVRARPRRDRLVAGLSRLARLALEHPRSIAAVGVAVLLASTWSATQSRVDNRLLALLSTDHPIRQASELADEKLGGVVALELLATLPSSATRPEQLAAFEQAETIVRRDPAVRTVMRPGQLGLDLLDDPWTRNDGQIARISVHMADRGAQAFQRASERIASDLAAAGWHDATSLGDASELGSPDRPRFWLTGSSYLAYDGINRIAAELRQSFVLVLVVVTSLIAWSFRSVRVALIALIPNMLPLVVGLAALDWLGWTVDPVSAVILTLAVGIAVDDTIHLLARLRQEGDVPLEQGLPTAMRSCGPALVVTSVVLSAGLAVNVFSSFPPLVQLGVLGAIVMLIALVCDLVLLPALLVCFPRAFGGQVVASPPLLSGSSSTELRAGSVHD